MSENVKKYGSFEELKKAQHPQAMDDRTIERAISNLENRPEFVLMSKVLEGKKNASVVLVEKNMLVKQLESARYAIKDIQASLTNMENSIRKGILSLPNVDVLRNMFKDSFSAMIENEVRLAKNRDKTYKAEAKKLREQIKAAEKLQKAIEAKQQLAKGIVNETKEVQAQLDALTNQGE